MNESYCVPKGRRALFCITSGADQLIRETQLIYLSVYGPVPAIPYSEDTETERGGPCLPLGCLQVRWG